MQPRTSVILRCSELVESGRSVQSAVQHLFLAISPLFTGMLFSRIAALRYVLDYRAVESFQRERWATNQNSYL